MPGNRRDTVLVAEDDLEVRSYLEMALRSLGYSVDLAQDGGEILAQLRASHSTISAVLLDLVMPQHDGIEVLKEIRRITPDLPVIAVSAVVAPTLNVVTAMKTGATDFLCMPIAHEDLRVALGRALEHPAVAQPALPVPAAAGKSRTFVGSNPRMREIYAQAAHVGWSEAPVLIQGETGSGREVLARDLHNHSPRASKIFLKLNCAALPSELVESELFGYERGAFTGAFQRKVGMFEAADGGTILLDEIGDMDVRLQAKLLQVLQDREFQRIGGKDTIKVDVRIIAATHRDLEKAIAERTFREDIYYRLGVISMVLPPLRERKEDIMPLAEWLLRKHAIPGRAVDVSPDLGQAMLSYHWPGNIRELENVVRKLCILHDPELIARELYDKVARRTLQPATAPKPPVLDTPVAAAKTTSNTPILLQATLAMQHAETKAILAALSATRWNRKQAAVLLKIDYKALLYKMKKLGVEDDVISSGRAATPKGITAGGS